ncbi:MAG: hypothetical protein EOS18_06485 [Mesorhizobium sp.]|nr:MAG: hypothetical protein EOS18_06485 [Mesorhizobium sp.]
MECGRQGTPLWPALFAKTWHLPRECGRQGTPLCPAGHLPLKGGDWQLQPGDFSCNVEKWRNRRRHPISPLEGEMAGRPEGGAVERYP